MAELRYGWGQPHSSTSFRYKRKCLEDYSHNLTKYEINGTSISPVYQLLSELQKIWKCDIDLYSKKTKLNEKNLMKKIYI